MNEIVNAKAVNMSEDLPPVLYWLHFLCQDCSSWVRIKALRMYSASVICPQETGQGIMLVLGRRKGER